MSEDEKVEGPSGSGEELAMGLALAKSRRRRSAGPHAPTAEEAFLATESRKAELEMHHLRLGHFDKLLTVGLKLLTAVVGLAIAVALGAMIWQAHEDHGLTIAAFSTPPDLAQRGLTGQVVAARVLDRLSALQAQTVSARPASTYADNWGDDIKVEIPETGVSIGELNAYLRQWLGHETRITGEMVRTPAGLSVTARAGADAGKAFEGPDADFDALVQQAAEAIYAQTQPYRYAVYLQSHGKPDEALTAFIRLARTGSPEDQRWAYTGWSALLMQRGDNAGAVAVVREGLRRGLSLHDTGGDANLVTAEGVLEHEQAMLEDMRQSLRRDRASRDRTIYSGPTARGVQRAVIAGALGDFRSESAGMGAVGDLAFEGGAVGTPLSSVGVVATRIQDHDVSGGLRALNAATASNPQGLDRLRLDRMAAQMLDDWPGYVALAEQEQALLLAAGPAQKDILERTLWPGLAVAYVRVGRQAEAEALVARMPLDCDRCVEARALAAAAKSDWAAADRWFAAVDRQAPDIPTWDTDWGQVLLAKGDLDGAIAKLKEAHKKGPHFADPLELWGEALMRKGDFAGAVGKFREADKHAPRWGRNHLRWGEALLLSGRYAEARAQFEVANGMDLSKSDRAALDVLLARTARGPLHG